MKQMRMYEETWKQCDECRAEGKHTMSPSGMLTMSTVGIVTFNPDTEIFFWKVKEQPDGWFSVLVPGMYGGREMTFDTKACAKKYVRREKRQYERWADLPPVGIA